MKRLHALVLTLASLGLAASSAEAKANGAAIAPATTIVASAFAPQWQNRPRWDRRDNRRARIETQTRLVRSGRRVYRETYQVRYFPNGRTQTMLVSRVRVR
ncbi:MAG: hypothetical protein QOJ76_2497 [Acidobacteriota bacterium]|jgi:hypothetical protein|nr:hypothetical protein [Acidobacteriota bacterium]